MGRTEEGCSDGTSWQLIQQEDVYIFLPMLLPVFFQQKQKGIRYREGG